MLVALGGGLYGHRWFYTNFAADSPALAGEHINTLELLTVLEGARRWGKLWSGRHVKIHSDNMASVIAVNKGTSRSPSFMRCLRELFWLSIKYGFLISAVHIKGDLNTLADMVSRLHVPSQSERFLKLVSPILGAVNCYNNMTFDSFLTLQGIYPTPKL